MNGCPAGMTEPGIRSAEGTLTLMSENGFTAAEMKEAELAWINSQPLKAACAICKWKFKGTAEEVLEAQKAHRLEHGFHKIRSRRSLRSLTSFKQNSLTDDDVDEIDTERRKRALVTGVEIAD